MAVCENSTAPSRRTLVAAALAVPVLTMAPGREDESILALFHRHIALRTTMNAAMSEAEADRVIVALDDLADRIMALPSRSAADFAAKLIVDSCCGDLSSDWERGALWIEARALTGMAR